MKDFRSLVRDIVDFPKEGIIFKDITPILADYEALKCCIDELCEPYLNLNIDKIVGIDARGFIFGSLMAQKLGCGFIPVRKKGKLPGKTFEEQYSLEYGVDSLEIHQDAISSSEKVVIVDDLLATGGTAEASVKLVAKLKAKIVGISFVIKLGFLNGEEKLSRYRVNSLIDIK